MATAVATAAVCPSPAFLNSSAAAPAVPVAVKTTGLPASPTVVACSVFAPASVESVQSPGEARPFASVSIVMELTPAILAGADGDVPG